MGTRLGWSRSAAAEASAISQVAHGDQIGQEPGQQEQQHDGGEQAHRHAGLKSITHFEGAGCLDQPIARFAMRLANRKEHAAGQASFAGAHVKGFGDHRNTSVEVSVGHHDHEIFRPAKRLYALPRVSTALIYELRDRC